MESAWPTRFDPERAKHWYAEWEKGGCFAPEGEGKPFTVTIPPPNITGSLHMGHALQHSVHDALARWRRMKGQRVQVVPGQDHAGISTQSVVLKKLKREGVDMRSLTREAFEEAAWAWRKESGDTIINQFRSLGCSFDWSQLRFTLDDDYVEAVHTAFIDWFDRGLIYRGLRVVNWDPTLKTSISDIETERQEIKGKLYFVRYPFADGTGSITVATTRPETIVADVAVAVSPDDERHQAAIGKELIAPITGRRIPVIADEYPDPAFGTGAVKITPGHDANDFEVGQRHGLETLIAFDEEARLNSLWPAYQGLTRENAREQSVADLEAAGLLEKVEPHRIALVISERSGDVVESLASEQWFLKQTAFAPAAIDAVRSGEIRFVPERYAKVYLEWMEGLRDWCISRQLWWGHRIPVFYTADGRAVAARTAEEASAKAGEPVVRQEEDVLDTWFSSGLWPFAVLGWPQQFDPQDGRWPTDLLTTARDIIYLWVARMAMMSLDQVQSIPFRDVYIHATVLNEKGQRMSKSLGTGVDPMDVISDKGADALRYALLSQTGFNQEVRYGDRKADEARSFSTKVWNASRFIAAQIEDMPEEAPEIHHPVDLWILSRFSRAAAQMDAALEAYNMQEACQAAYRFVWTELCDWYLEVSKARLQTEDRAAVQHCLHRCLTGALRLLHPIMPFVTEEIHFRLNPSAGFLMREAWPKPESVHEETEGLVEGWIEVVRALRALRIEAGLAPRQRIQTLWHEGTLHGGQDFVSAMGLVDEIREGRPEAMHLSGTAAGVDLHLLVSSDLDVAAEVERLKAEEQKMDKELSGLRGRLGNPAFVEKANPEIVARDQAAADELASALERTRARRAQFEKALG